jgi:hypothetical protein
MHTVETIVIRLLFSALLAVTASMPFASVATRAEDASPPLPASVGIDAALRDELALSYRILVREGVLDAYGQ